MRNYTTPTKNTEVELAITTANDLRGRQSVRTTFKLSAHTIHAVSIVAAHLGIKQKSLFDHLIDDMSAAKLEKKTLESHPAHYNRKTQKTYVISRRSLDALERASKTLHISRDLLVELSVQRLLPMLDAERQQHEKRKEVLTKLHNHVVKAKTLLRETCKLLGEDDFVAEKIAVAAKALELAEQLVADCVDRGRIIETHPPNKE